MSVSRAPAGNPECGSGRKKPPGNGAADPLRAAGHHSLAAGTIDGIAHGESTFRFGGAVSTCKRNEASAP
ncbi:MAG: hypothetical protein F9K38_06625 [Pseudorhodoplanes sp.]|nr:MAG: hypothetical protein F9K38_06625 [Pseudorhodoplanes sp.]